MSKLALVEFNKLSGEKWVLATRVENYTREVSCLKEELDQRVEEIELYESGLRDALFEVVVDLDQYVKLKQGIHLGKEALEATKAKIAITEALLLDEKAKLKALEEQMASLQAVINGYGRIYKFPARDH